MSNSNCFVTNNCHRKEWNQFVNFEINYLLNDFAVPVYLLESIILKLTHVLLYWLNWNNHYLNICFILWYFNYVHFINQNTKDEHECTTTNNNRMTCSVNFEFSQQADVRKWPLGPQVPLHWSINKWLLVPHTQYL